MNSFIQTTASLLNVLTVATDVLIGIYVISFILGWLIKPIRNVRNSVIRGIIPYTRIVAFIIALTATGGSLFYSDIAKYTPCLLCWWQRIFMYPQTLLILMGIIKNDKNIADYTTGMSIAGALIAAYHYYIQLGGKSFLTCSQIGFSQSCTQRFSMEYGYVTIPMMSLTAFIAIILLMRLSNKIEFS